jgi:Sulfotransferase domain
MWLDSRSALNAAARRMGKTALSAWIEAPARVAFGLRRLGLQRLAEEVLEKVYSSSPYDLPLGAMLADLLFDNHQGEFPLGSMERALFLLQTMNISFASRRVIEAYFENLEAMLQRQERLETPGMVVLGLGSGRSGSTTMAGLLRTIAGGKSTHENPVPVFWDPHPQQVEFHLRRFRLLTAFFSVVADCSVWWINLMETVAQALPTTKAIGVYRDTEAFVRSVKPKMRSWNPYATPHNGIWKTYHGDPLCPHYELPENAWKDPDAARESLIRRYVTDYNNRLKALAQRMPERMLLLRTEELSEPSTLREISKFLGLRIVEVPIHRNLGRQESNVENGFWF